MSEAKRVRAKFRCDEVNQHMGGRQKKEQGDLVWVPEKVITIKMSPVYSEEEGSENKKFWDATPSGSLELQSVFEDAVGHIEVGKEYYLDIVAAPGNDAEE